MRDLPLRTQPQRLAQARRLAQGPAGLVSLALLGIFLMVGAPLLAGSHDDGHDDHGTAVQQADDHGADTHAADDHSADDHADDGHGAGHGDAHGEDHGGGMSHFPTLIQWIANGIEGKKLHGNEEAKHSDSAIVRFLYRFEPAIYSGILIAILAFLFGRAARNLTMIPGKGQNVAEFLVDGLDGFIRDVIGPHGRQFVPFLGTLGIYIYVMNIFGLIPLMFSPTAVINTTAAMALCVFVYVQYTALRMNGVKGHLFHLAGEPRDAVGWAMVPLMFPLHVIGEIAKPLSLALRLFGNVMGEELLLAVFAGLGVAILAFTQLPVGVPLHLPFIFLGLLTTLIQALVFMLLSTIYIALVLPHDDHAGH